MTKEDAVQRLDALAEGFDNEAVHSNADDVLLDFLRANGFPEVADAYERCRKTVGFWYA